MSSLRESHDVIEQLTEVRGPAQPPSNPDTNLMLQELIVNLFVRLDIVSSSNVLLVPSIAPPRFISPSNFSSAAIFVAEQKSFERFARLTPLKFDGTVGEKTYDFLTEF
ncbi:hypothetical protein H5410_000744 [Solanum commersonii]|uniref:Uncharacterized protein n=1 Tax=Solanum commersonii TaxID=4109 RepID=A0A9J6AXS8_SOLCO|nr:hypothetical protein H5410_000744 [Solanum commersonii]